MSDEQLNLIDDEDADLEGDEDMDGEGDEAAARPNNWLPGHQPLIVRGDERKHFSQLIRLPEAKRDWLPPHDHSKSDPSVVLANVGRGGLRFGSADLLAAINRAFKEQACHHVNASWPPHSCRCYEPYSGDVLGWVVEFNAHGAMVTVLGCCTCGREYVATATVTPQG